MPKPIKKKVPKKGAVEAEAKNYADGMRTFYSLRKKQIQFALLTVVLVALVGGGVFFFLRSAALKASSLFSEGYTRYVAALPQNNEDQLREALDLFRKSYESRKSPLVLYYESDIYERLGEFENAESSLRALLEGYPNDRNVLPLAYVKLGMLYREIGDYEKALETLGKLERSDAPFFRDLALYQRASILTLLGRTDEAKEATEELGKRFPTSPYVEQGGDATQSAGPGEIRQDDSSGIK